MDDDLFGDAMFEIENQNDNITYGEFLQTGGSLTFKQIRMLDDCRKNNLPKEDSV